MKKSLFLILICLGFLNTVFAQEINTKKNAKTYRQELVQHQDELLEFLLQIPFEQRQYIFPMVSENKSVSKKIKTHPDVLVWKGKRPTRIAKRFQNDPELLEFLPAQFYYFLAPEMWPDESDKSLEQNPNQLFINFTQSMPTDETFFSAGDLVQLKNALDITYASLTQEQKERLKNSSEIYLSQIMLFNSPELAKKLKKQGYNSPREFAQKVDKISSIYRQYKKGNTPSSSAEQEFVKNYFSLLPYVFERSGFKVLLDVKSYSD